MSSQKLCEFQERPQTTHTCKKPIPFGFAFSVRNNVKVSINHATLVLASVIPLSIWIPRRQGQRDPTHPTRHTIDLNWTCPMNSTEIFQILLENNQYKLARRKSRRCTDKYEYRVWEGCYRMTGMLSTEPPAIGGRQPWLNASMDMVRVVLFHNVVSLL